MLWMQDAMFTVRGAICLRNGTNDPLLRTESAVLETKVPRGPGCLSWLPKCPLHIKPTFP